MPTGAQENDHLLDAVALLVLDVQERLLPVMADAEAFTDRVAFAIEAARIFNIRVVFTEQVPEKLGPTLPALRSLVPNARVFRKTSFSALQAKGLQDYLRELNVYHLLVCGLETTVCIYQTALQAADLDLDTTLLSDCLASRRPEDDAFVLPALIRSGCHVLPSESVFYSMAADSTHPRFRAFSDLVKRHEAVRRGEVVPPPRPEPEPVPAERAPAVDPAPAPSDQTQVERSGEPRSPDRPGTSETPRPKRSRGRRRKTPTVAETDTAVPAGPTETNPPSAELAPTGPTKQAGSPEAEGEAPRKPRRRRRGARKPKGNSGDSPPDDAPSRRADEAADS